MTRYQGLDGAASDCAAAAGEAGSHGGERRHSMSSMASEASCGELEIEDCLNMAGFGRFQWRIISVAGLLLTVDAMEMMLLSFLGPSMRCEFDISPESEALLTTVVFLGMMIGSYSCGVLADRYGRLAALKVLAASTFALGAMSAFVPSFTGLVVLRGLTGVCLGGSSIGFAYVMEFLPTASRGRWGILLELFWSLGTFLEALLAWAVFSDSGKHAWRVLLFISSLPVLIAAVCFLLNVVPQSPRYLSTSGRAQEAYEVLREVARVNGKSLPANGVLRAHVPSHGSSKGNPLNLLQVLRTVFSPTFRQLTLFLWFLWFTNAFSYYGVVLLTTSLAVANSEPLAGANGTVTEYCDPETNSPFQGSGTFVAVFIATISELPGTLFAAFLVDSVGRKQSQAICFGGAFVALVVLFFKYDSSAISTVCLFCGRALVTASFVITYLYTPEAYPTSIRTTAFGIANSFSRLGGMVSPFVGEDLIERGEFKLAIFLFCLFTGMATITSLLLPVETKGAALADTPDELEVQMTGLDRPQRQSELGSSGALPRRRREGRDSASSPSLAHGEQELIVI